MARYSKTADSKKLYPSFETATVTFPIGNGGTVQTITDDETHDILADVTSPNRQADSG